jgi:NAD(P)H-hydrate epimerase
VRGRPLVSPGEAAELDREASASWGLNPFALVEAAGRACAAALAAVCAGPSYGTPEYQGSSGGCLGFKRILVCAGPGNNGADALVLLRALLSDPEGPAPFDSAVMVSRRTAAGEESPRSEALAALEKMGVPVFAWGEDGTEELLDGAGVIADVIADVIIDGIAGTGIRGALEGVPLEMAEALNRLSGGLSAAGDTAAGYGRAARRPPPQVVSIDVPSGAGSEWRPGFPLVRAAYTLAIEPLKTVLYTPSIRPACGRIIPVGGIFPPALINRYGGGAELLGWKEAAAAIPPVSPGDYKYRRGLAEIHAGASGTAGAARIAAAGASAAGAGLVRLVVDDAMYPVLASSAGGVMTVPSPPDGEARDRGRFEPDAMLLGPGWGREGREGVMRRALEAEQGGTALVLDADALALLRKADGSVPAFHGGAILTPHAGEMEALTGIGRERLLAEPELVAEWARRLNAVILFKSHVMIAAGPRGGPVFIDGMDPALGAGGSGDLLAGLCAGIAARTRGLEKRGGPAFDPLAVAAAAGALLLAASRRAGRRFYDPLELAGHAAALAGEAWLP